MYHFVLILAGNLTEPLARCATGALHIHRDRGPWKVFQFLRTGLLVCVGELFFRAESLRDGLAMFRRMVTGFSLTSIQNGAVYQLGMDKWGFLIVLAAVLVVLRDSEAFSHISPMEMWQRQGFTSYVCGTSSQYLYWSDTVLRRAFQNQKPKVVILETNAIYRDLSRKDTLVNRRGNWFPVFRYHNRWKSIRSGGFLSPVEYTWTDDYKGFLFNNTVDPATYMNHMAPTEEAAPILSLNQ